MKNLREMDILRQLLERETFVSEINKELVKERQMEIIEHELCNIIDNVKRINLSRDEFYKIINLLWED